MMSRFSFGSLLLATVGVAGLLFSLGIVFGLGLLSAPEKKIQADGVSPYLARVEGAADRAQRVEQDQRTLSPIYPSSPQVAGDTKAPVPQAAATDGNAPPAVQETEAEPEAKPVAATAAPAPVPAAAAPNANATPIPNASANACNVSACAAAYRSFRESDCTYQPFDGPRRLCTNPPAPAQASTQPLAPRPPADLDDAADEVRRLTQDDGVYPPPSMRGDRRLIVIERY